MRTGVIFARGRCRALKWLALFGVVFVLGGGSGVAQPKNYEIEFDADRVVREGASTTITVMLSAEVPANTGSDTVIDVMVGVRQPGASAFAGAGWAAGTTPAELNNVDVTFADVATSFTMKIPKNTTGNSERLGSKKSILLQTNTDTDAEDEALVFYATAGSDSSQTPHARSAQQLIIDDEQTQSYVLSLPKVDGKAQDPTEAGDPVKVKLEAKPKHVQGYADLYFHIDDSKYEIDAESLGRKRIGRRGDDRAPEDGVPDSGPFNDHTVEITVPNSDGDRESDTITLSVHSGQAGNSMLEDSLQITVKDKDPLPMVTAMVVDDKGEALDPQPMSVMEGETVMVKVMPVDKDGKVMKAMEDLSVMLAPSSSSTADGMDYRIYQAISVPEGMNSSAAVSLELLDNDDVGAEMLVLDATVSGEAAIGSGTEMSEAVLSLEVKDETTPLVWVKDDAYDAIMMALGDDPLNPGDSAEIMTDDLFGHLPMVDVSYGARVEGGAVSASASGEMVMLMAEAAGSDTKVTVIATASMGDSLMTHQDRANVAELTFPVMVELADLMVELMGPEDKNLVEGMSYEISAMANRPVEMDTMVELVQTDGTASPSDYTVEPITIMAGDKMGMTTLTVEPDAMMENDGNMAEMLTLEGRFVDDISGDTMPTYPMSLSFYLWDAAVPALPVIAQLLLAAFLAVGGYRRYRRR